MNEPILLFDGVCGFCSAIVHFALRHDRTGALRFAPRQSALGQRLLREHGVDPEEDTIVLVDGPRALLRSDAALFVAGHLRFPWRCAALLSCVPRSLRDAAYDFVARRRYSVFGKTEACMRPSPEERGRFLDGA